MGDRPTLIVLIGPKGSGKSHVGRILEAHHRSRFFHVEPHWMRYHAACAREGREVNVSEGTERVRPFLRGALQDHGCVTIETTGASPEILQDLLEYRSVARLILVKVEAPLALCLGRIAKRDPTDQIPLDEAAVRRVYALSQKVGLRFDVTLENISMSDQEVLQAFDRIDVDRSARACRVGRLDAMDIKIIHCQT